MGMDIDDKLPMDMGDQKFLALVSPDSPDEFVLLAAAQVQTESGKKFAGLRVLPHFGTETTHEGTSVGTGGVKQGASGSATSAVDARGFSKCSAFVTISGLAEGEVVTMTIHRRIEQTGDDFTPVLVAANDLANGRNFVSFEVDAPFFMVELATSFGTATITCELYMRG